jgi:DNA-binding transcriptional MerR regulator
MNEYGFFSKDVALKLDINASTLRQWCLAMEKEGYEFQKNDKNQRIFYDRDISLLFELKMLIEKTRNRDDAIKSVVSKRKSVDNTEKLLSVNENERDNITVSKSDLEEIIQRSVEKAIEKERESMFKAFEMKLNDTVEQRDRYLLHQLNESMEQKRLEIAAAKEEEENKKPRKGIFSWFKGD